MHKKKKCYSLYNEKEQPNTLLCLEIKPKKDYHIQIKSDKISGRERELMNFNIALISGDGIGPEIVAEAKKVLDKVCEVYGHTF